MGVRLHKICNAQVTAGRQAIRHAIFGTLVLLHTWPDVTVTDGHLKLLLQKLQTVFMRKKSWGLSSLSLVGICWQAVVGAEPSERR
jgi:hypothetical protein